MTKIKPCTCGHKFQDEKHGKGKRVFNSAKDDQWRCTVCGSTVKEK